MRNHLRIGGVALLLSASLALLSGPATAGCESAAKIAADLDGKYRETANRLGCSVAAAASSGQFPADACLKLAGFRKKIRDELVGFWNQMADGSWATLGPRPLRLDESENGTLVSLGTRLFVTQTPVDHSEVEIRLRKRDGRLPAAITVCVFGQGGQKEKAWDFRIPRGAGNKGETWSHTLDGTYGRFVSVLLAGKAADPRKLAYSLRATGVGDGVGAALLHANGKGYFFRGERYLRFDFGADRVDREARTGIDGWTGLRGRVDAALLHPNGRAYFFRGDEYLRYDSGKKRVDKEARTGVDGWEGLPRDLDAALMHPNGKAYFFRGETYYRFDFDRDRVDKTARIGEGGWKGLEGNLDAALMHPNGKAYFFKGDTYFRFDFSKDEVDKRGRVGADGWKGL